MRPPIALAKKTIVEGSGVGVGDATSISAAGAGAIVPVVAGVVGEVVVVEFVDGIVSDPPVLDIDHPEGNTN